jgi:cyclic pyranopterin phosphate synthase
LSEEKFAKITRWGRLSQVLDGIDTGLNAGISIKINTVAIKGENDDELEDFVRWCAARGLDQTFIEVMPMGEMGEENRLDQFWSLKDLRTRLAQSWTLNEIDLTTGGPATYVELAETGQKIGFITPLSHNFCESCNRVRVTCTGHLFQCLGQEMETDLRQVLRDNPDDDTALISAIKSAIDKKPRGHDFDYSRQKISGEMSRHMSHTGG